jgi:hypothetical protein
VVSAQFLCLDPVSASSSRACKRAASLGQLRELLPGGLWLPLTPPTSSQSSSFDRASLEARVGGGSADIKMEQLGGPERRDACCGVADECGVASTTALQSRKRYEECATGICSQSATRASIPLVLRMYHAFSPGTLHCHPYRATHRLTKMEELDERRRDHIPPNISHPGLLDIPLDRRKRILLCSTLTPSPGR